jgi:hypothetical protein
MRPVGSERRTPVAAARSVTGILHILDRPYDDYEKTS